MFQILGLLIWLIMIPFCIGLLPAAFVPEEKRTPGFIFLAGCFTMWALFGLVTIPVVVFVRYDNFILASNCFLALSIVSASAGIWLTCRRRGVHTSGRKPGTGGTRIFEMSWAERMEWFIFLLLLGFQLYKAAAYASFDGDDAYYVVESLIAQQADTMYTILPLTGRHTGLDIRHAMAVFPMWVAFVATKSHIHATALSHTILPLLLIPLTYLVYFEIGRILFRDGAGSPAAGCGDNKEKGSAGRNADAVKGKENLLCRENLPIFMILMGMFQIFGNVSIYTNETFFLTRTWQGKAVAGSLVIPALLWLFLLLYQSTGANRFHKAGLWFLLVCVNMTAGICSSIAVFLVSMLMAVTALCLAFVERDYKVLFKMGAACIPNALYVLLYLAVGHGYLL